MRFISVEATEFGPFAPNQSLEFAPGMSIFYGPNEAGKSSWHAALYAALCGRRRTAGKQDPSDTIFEARHRPWANVGSGRWVVKAVLELKNGHQIELRHDLTAKTASGNDRNTGARYDLGITDGAPDGATLLGLDRQAFLATACVRQADLLAVRESSGQLQGYLQKAVAGGSDDSTVAGALNAIKVFRDEFVGAGLAGAKPLKAAIDGLKRCNTVLEEAKQKHEHYLNIVAEADELKVNAAIARRKLDLVLARRALIEASGMQVQLKKARALQPRFPSGKPPSAGEDGDLASAVTRAPANGANRPQAPILTGPTADELRPEQVEMPDTHGLPESELRAPAFDLRRETSPIDHDLEEQEREIKERLTQYLEASRSRFLPLAGLMTLGSGLVLLVPILALGIVLIIIGAAILAWAATKRPLQPPSALQAELTTVEQERTRQTEKQIAAIVQQHHDAAELMRLLGNRSLADFEAEASRKKAQAVVLLAKSLPEDDLEKTILEPDVDAQIDRLRLEHEGLEGQYNHLQGRIKTEAAQLRSVPEAVEALEEAHLELQRVEKLRDTLNRTETFLKEAQSRVHQDVAPRLAEAVARRLPQITRENYREVMVDPKDLNVRVRLPDGTLKSAHLLSHGTAEQVYLLLRVAMAELLTKPDEVCPLVLDDVTVQSDAVRTVAILETLLALSAERQIILFSQEEEVLHWAETNLVDTGQNNLYHLPLIGAIA
ncbi:MAG: hypothetical protein EXR50_07470 [Dehalococcoidia bacterium]|nr:hypothetical protein [Dehalococcoidia bacterium]